MFIFSLSFHFWRVNISYLYSKSSFVLKESVCTQRVRLYSKSPFVFSGIIFIQKPVYLINSTFKPKKEYSDTCRCPLEGLIVITHEVSFS